MDDNQGGVPQENVRGDRREAHLRFDTATCSLPLSDLPRAMQSFAFPSHPFHTQAHQHQLDYFYQNCL